MSAVYGTNDSHGAMIIGSCGTKREPGRAVDCGDGWVSWMCSHKDCFSMIEMIFDAKDTPEKNAAHMVTMINEMRAHELEHQGIERPKHPMLP